MAAIGGCHPAMQPLWVVLNGMRGNSLIMRPVLYHPPLISSGLSAAACEALYRNEQYKHSLPIVHLYRNADDGGVSRSLRLGLHLAVIFIENKAHKSLTVLSQERRPRSRGLSSRTDPFSLLPYYSVVCVFVVFASRIISRFLRLSHPENCNKLWRDELQNAKNGVSDLLRRWRLSQKIVSVMYHPPCSICYSFYTM